MMNGLLFVYLDNILIFSQTEEDHVDHVRQLLEMLLQDQLFVKAEKCVFPQMKVLFHLVQSNQD